MTTFVQFVPPVAGAFTFAATLDNQSHQMVVTWNVFGQRWYLTCIGGDNTVVFTLPLIGSPQEMGINLAGGYFSVSTLVFRNHTQMFEITP